MIERAAAHPAGPVVAVGAGIAVTLAHAAVHADGRAVSYAVVVGLVGLVCLRIDRTARLSPGVRWGLAAAGVAHLAGGVVRVAGVEGGILYNAWLVRPVLHVDQAAHGLGYAVATVAAWQALGRWFDPGRRHPVAGAVLAALVAAGIGAVNEAAEFVATYDLGGTAVGGFANTGFDLLFDLGGAAAAATYLALRHRPAGPAAVSG